MADDKTQKRQIFRQESLEKLSSPDRLDQLLRVIKPQGWIVLFAMGIGLALAVTWSIIGAIPTTANGTAILVKPKKVIPFQSPGSGQLKKFLVHVGDEVEEGDVVAELHLPDLEKDIQLEEDKLEQFLQRKAEELEIEENLAAERRSLIQEKRDFYEGRKVEIAKEAADVLEEHTLFIKRELEKVASTRDMAEHLGGLLAELQTSYEELRNFREGARPSEAGAGQAAGDEGVAGDEQAGGDEQAAGDEQAGGYPLVSKVQLYEAKIRKISNDLQLQEYGVESAGLELDLFEAQVAYKDRMDQIKELDLELKTLRQEELEIGRDLKALDLRQRNEEQEIRRTIERLQSFKDQESRVLAPKSGEILEITANLGEQVSIGTRLGKMEIDDPEAKLMAVAFFPLKDGKKIDPKVDQSVRVSPITVQRERFGGIKGKVEWRSEYPVTTDAAANEIGDIEIARNLLRGESRIEVRISLDEDPDPDLEGGYVSGFRWTSGKGPKHVEITAGTTADVRVTIEKRAPITFVLPYLKSLF